MSTESMWEELCEDSGGDPSPLDALDFIASNGSGWQAGVASLAYLREIQREVQRQRDETEKS